MATLYYMVGIPGAGKSTFCSKNFKEEEILASDTLREKFGLSPIDPSVFPMIQKIEKERLEQGLDACVDSTGLLAIHRKPYIDIAKAAGAKAVCIIIDTDLELALARDRGRQRHVPEDVIKDMYNTLKENYPDKSEGFDEILVLTSDDIIKR